MKKRLISIAIMLSIVIPLLIIRGKVFAVAVGLIGLVIYKEIMDLKKEDERGLPLLASIAGLISFLLIIYSNYDGVNLLFGLSYSKLAISLLIVLIPVIFIADFKKYSPMRAMSLWGLILLVGLGLNLLICLVNYNINYFLYIISITIFTDTFAFIVGMLIGKHKCAKLISPNKSWEGCIGGSIFGTAIAVMVYLMVVRGPANLFALIGITFLLSIIAQIGDLFFSSIKRAYKIKDFSNLIPGHGGMLDRLDSLIFEVIAYVIFMSYL